MANVKVSELEEATSFENDDYTMIIQGNKNKKITKENMLKKDVYSLQETKTNKIWIDGKPIYRKVVDFGVLPNASSKEVPSGITNVDYVVSIEGVRRNQQENTFTSLPSLSTTESIYFVDITLLNNNIRIRAGSDRSNEIAYVILEYTKTTD